MINRRQLVLMFGTTLIVGGESRAQQVASHHTLLTSDDLRQEQDALTQAGMTSEQAAEEYWRVNAKSGPGAPQILVRKPDVGSPVKSPFVIEVDFLAAEGSQIEVGSFRVKYGFLGIDVTSRIREYAEISAKGLNAEVDDMPAGNHNFELTISDNLKRSCRQRLHCEVVS